MKAKCIIAAVLSVAMMLPASGRCGSRKGPVFGFGIGVSPAVITSGDIGFAEYDISGAGRNSTVSNVGMASVLFLGYAFTNRDVVLATIEDLRVDRDYLYVNGFSGIGYAHYFGVEGKSLFLSGALGQEVSGWPPHYGCTREYHYGPGFRLEGGYEFWRHCQAGLTIGLGETERGGYKYTHSSVSVNLTIVAY